MKNLRSHLPLFVDFLEQEAQDDQSSVRFPARNFLLDENVPEDRVRSYGEECADVGYDDAKFDDAGDWVDGHTAYLEERIRLERPKNQPPTTLNPQSPYCPETFRTPDNLVAYGGAHASLDLLRVVDLGAAARFIQIDAAQWQKAAEEIVQARADGRSPDAGLETFFDQALSDWNSLCDLRPFFATFYVDHEDLLKDRPSDDADGWADELRDRLGLLHIAPSSTVSESPILVFRYAVAEIPKMVGGGPKALALPTVLDVDLNPAFCPAPPNQDAGQTVHLSGDTAVCREVLHPFMDFESKHLFRVGVVKKSAPADISDVRWEHLRALRRRFQRPDYAAVTDPEA